MPFHPATLSEGHISFSVGDGATEIAPGIYYIDVYMPYDCTIVDWTILAPKEEGSIVFDIWVSHEDTYPPTVEHSITASDKPTLSAARSASGASLTEWDTALHHGDTIRINVDSVEDLTLATLVLSVQRHT